MRMAESERSGFQRGRGWYRSGCCPLRIYVSDFMSGNWRTLISPCLFHTLIVSLTVFDLIPSPSGAWSFSATVTLPIQPTFVLHLFAGTKILSSDGHERFYLWDLKAPEVALQLRNIEAGEVRS